MHLLLHKSDGQINLRYSVNLKGLKNNWDVLMYTLYIMTLFTGTL